MMDKPVHIGVEFEAHQLKLDVKIDYLKLSVGDLDEMAKSVGENIAEIIKARWADWQQEERDTVNPMGVPKWVN